jgi:TatD family-associated radical SAM protein
MMSTEVFMSEEHNDKSLSELAMVIAYPLNGSLYLNITNRCPNACRFCIRETGGVGYNLWLEHDPAVNEIIEAIGDPAQYHEVVFCGYGEPLTRPDVVVEVARWLKEKQAKVRMNTNGLADLFLGYDILPRLAGVVDTISISLNASDAGSYAEITRTAYGLDAFPAVLDFAARSREYIPNVVLTAVEYPGVDLKKAAAIARKLNIPYRIRVFQQ